MTFAAELKSDSAKMVKFDLNNDSSEFCAFCCLQWLMIMESCLMPVAGIVTAA